MNSIIDCAQLRRILLPASWRYIKKYAHAKLNRHKYSIRHINGAWSSDVTPTCADRSIIDCLEIINATTDCLHGRAARVYDWTCCRPLCICTFEELILFHARMQRISSQLEQLENNAIGCARTLRILISLCSFRISLDSRV